MTIRELEDLRNQLEVLKEVAKYGVHTIENIIQQIDARIKNHERQK